MGGLALRQPAARPPRERSQRARRRADVPLRRRRSRSGGRDRTCPAGSRRSARHFGHETVALMQKDAIERKGITQLLFEPETMPLLEKNVELVALLLSAQGMIPDAGQGGRAADRPRGRRGPPSPARAGGPHGGLRRVAPRSSLADAVAPQPRLAADDPLQPQGLGRRAAAAHPGTDPLLGEPAPAARVGSASRALCQKQSGKHLGDRADLKDGVAINRSWAVLRQPSIRNDTPFAGCHNPDNDSHALSLHVNALGQDLANRGVIRRGEYMNLLRMCVENGHDDGETDGPNGKPCACGEPAHQAPQYLRCAKDCCGGECNGECVVHQINRSCVGGCCIIPTTHRWSEVTMRTRKATLLSPITTPAICEKRLWRKPRN